MRSVHLVHVEPYSACVHVHVCAHVCAYVYVCACTPEHKLGCGQWTEDGGAGSKAAQPHWPLSTLLLRPPTGLSAVPALAVMTLSPRHQESGEGLRALLEVTGPVHSGLGTKQTTTRDARARALSCCLLGVAPVCGAARWAVVSCWALPGSGGGHTAKLCPPLLGT